MKRKLFFIINSIFLITIIGIGAQSCSDDDDNDNETTNPEVGEKVIDLRIVDENGNLTTADVTVWKNGDSLKTIQVAGTYSLDVTDYPTNTKFEFMAKRVGYLSSDRKSVTLEYSDDSQIWQSYLILSITKKASSFIVDQSVTDTISFPSNIDPERNIYMIIPARITSLQYLQISPTPLPTAASQGLLEGDAPNGNPAFEIISFESDWERNFNDGGMITVIFPITQEFINAAANYGLDMEFGTKDNATNTWESYPVTIDTEALTGTVKIPHFSTWYLAITESVILDVSNSSEVTLGTSNCGESITVNFDQSNSNLNPEYSNIFGLKALSTVSQTYTSYAGSDAQVNVQAHCTQVSLTIPGTSVSFVYFQPPVIFTSTTASCSHIGGGGQ